MLNLAPNFVIDNDNLILPYIPCDYVDPSNLNIIMGLIEKNDIFFNDIEYL